MHQECLDVVRIDTIATQPLKLIRAANAAATKP